MNQCKCGLCETVPHDSDCAVHNEPATPNGDCDCKRGNVVIAGKDITAGLNDDPDELSTVAFGIVIEFQNGDEMREAIRNGRVEFTVFGD
jgi:hypothetical protein